MFLKAIAPRFLAALTVLTMSLSAAEGCLRAEHRHSRGVVRPIDGSLGALLKRGGPDQCERPDLDSP
jgi:hypothetical protein